MKKLLAVILLLTINYSLFAQMPGAGRPGGGGQQLTGRVYGKIIDSLTQKPLEYVSVQLVQNRFDSVTRKRKEVIVGGMLTLGNGDFSIENVPVFGQYKIKISGIGYVPFAMDVAFDIKMGGGTTGFSADMSSMAALLDKDLGNIQIRILEKLLEGVTVTADKPMLQMGIDRKVFNVDKNIVSAGGTAVDIMRNVPSLNVDIDGNVSLRNNAPQIFVDGRPTTMELDQIPADAIESVEIITNPSAKFDASGGTAGILNIILKKNRKAGYNGSVRSNIDSRARIGMGGDLNIRQNKVNAFVSGNFNQRRSISKGTTDRLSLIDNPNNILHQRDRSDMDGHFAFGRAGIDYFMNNRSTLTASINLSQGRFNPSNKSDLLIDTLKNPVAKSFIQRFSSTERKFDNLGSMIGFKHNFPKAGREITADINYNSRDFSNNNLVSTQLYQQDLTTKADKIDQRQLGDGKSSSLIVQTDYINPLSPTSKMEMGLRMVYNENNSNNAFYLVNPNGQLILQPSSQVDYKSNDRVMAAYTTYSSRIKDFGYQLGLRAESSTYNGELAKTSETFKIDFPVSLFPSVFLNQKMKNSQEMQLNYSRRINRPNFWQLSPFTDSSDFLNLSKGNPGLNPEFTNSLELSYNKTFKKNRDNLLVSLYYKNTTDLITRFQEVQREPGTNKEQVINTFINANSSFVTGLELIMKTKITKWWDLTSNLNLFTSKITVNDPSVPEQEQFMSWFGKINNSFKLSKSLSFQLSGDYQSKTILPPGGSGSGGGGGGHRGGGGMWGTSTSAQGFIRPIYSVDAAIRYEFLKDRKASLSVNMNDIFRTRVSDVYGESPFFIQDVFRRRDPQVLRVNFNWRFGKFDASMFRRKNNRMQDGSSGMEGMGM